MKIVINDANILIDLVKLDLLDDFSKLNFELHTTDFVYEELNDEQRSPVSSLREKGLINIIETIDIIDFQEINKLLESSNGLSFEDCSVWYYSSKMSGILLSGDGKIYVFDQLLVQKRITFDNAIEKIKQLVLFNNRLPKAEIDKRIEFWRAKTNLG